MSRQLAGKILREFARKITGDKQPEERNGELSDREKDVLRLVAEGMTNRDIGGRLNLSENTIKYHLKNIMQKLHLKNRAQAVAFALQSGMLKEKK